MVRSQQQQWAKVPGAPLNKYDQVNDSTLSDLPTYDGVVWVQSMGVPAQPFLIDLCSGRPRPGDLCSWSHMLAPNILHLRFDTKFGGHAQNIRRESVVDHLVTLGKHELCMGGVIAIPCDP